jgi:hypothetical protein
MRLSLFLIGLGGFFFFTGIAIQAQDQTPVFAEVSAITPDNIDKLIVGGKIEGNTPVEVNVTGAQLGTTGTVLQKWVQAGGVVLLHTDAARLFGFQTVAPRQRTKDRAGLRWGSAHNALPFGAHPLLWGNTSADGSAMGMPGIHSVFYHLDDDETLLVNDRTSSPLLRVEDPTFGPVNGPARPLYIAAARRFGLGWALFAPRHIEMRGDGAQFWANLSQFMKEAQNGQWLSLPAYKSQENSKWEHLQQSLSSTTPNAARNTVEVPVPQTEAKILESVWNEAGTDAVHDEATQSRANALLYLLLARSSWQSDSAEEPYRTPDDVAALWGPNPKSRLNFFETQEGGEGENLARWWNGVLALGAAVPPVPTSSEPSLYPFSYVAPAREAFKWWSREGIPIEETRADEINVIKGTGEYGDEGEEQAAQDELTAWPTGLTEKQIAQSVDSVRNMARLHRNDPALMSSWLTPGGTRYFMQLSPLQAASPKFPALVEEWGSPSISTINPNTKVSIPVMWKALVPLNSPLAMPYNGGPSPIMHNPANQIVPNMIWRCSQFWSDRVAPEWGWHKSEVHVQIQPVYSYYANYQISSLRRFTQPNMFPGMITPHDENGIAQMTMLVHLPVATLDAYMRQPKGQMREVKYRKMLDGTQALYVDGLESDYEFSDDVGRIIPARMARVSSHQILASALMGRDDPDLEWIDEGLQNLFSLTMAQVIEQQPDDSSTLTMMPPPEFKTRNVLEVRHHLAEVMAEEAKVDKRAGAPATDGTPTFGIGGNLEDRKSSQMVSFLYELYGKGAVEEVLQRMGAGDIFDKALNEATGDSKAQFLQKFEAK